jgi:hypothetical protein
VRITWTLTTNKSKLAILLHVSKFYFETLGNTIIVNPTTTDRISLSDHSNSLPNCQIAKAAKIFIISLNKYIDGGDRGRHHANESLQLTNQKEKSEQEHSFLNNKVKEHKLKMVFVLLVPSTATFSKILALFLTAKNNER